MDGLWTMCRFVGSVARYYMTPTPPDYQVVSAECDGSDVTPDVISWLAVSGYAHCEQTWPKDKRLVLTYRKKGNGPFVLYFDAGESLVFPPVTSDEAPSLSQCVVSVEVIRSGEDEPTDITDRGLMLAGPDGRWDGRLELPRRLDPRVLYPEAQDGDEIAIYFADGSRKMVK